MAVCVGCVFLEIEANHPVEISDAFVKLTKTRNLSHQDRQTGILEPKEATNRSSHENMHLKHDFFKESNLLSLCLLAVYLQCCACVILKPASSQASLKQRHHKNDNQKSKYFFYSKMPSTPSSPSLFTQTTSATTTTASTTSSSYLEELVVKSVIDKISRPKSQETTSPIVFDLKYEVKRDSSDYNDIEQPGQDFDFNSRQREVNSKRAALAPERNKNKLTSKQKQLQRTGSVGSNVRGECKLRPVEVTLHLENCGYFTVNTTACAGLCKSEEHVIANTNLKRRSCSACRPTRFSVAKYNVYCTRTKEYKVYEMKAISSCKCFKYAVDSKIEIAATILPSSAFQDTEI